MAKIVTNLQQKLEIEKLLEEHFDKEEGRYRAGWTDEVVAEIVAAKSERPLTRNHVDYHRKQTGRSTVKAAPSTNDARLDRVEKLLTRLYTELGLQLEA